jgi:hypothetical protein
MLKVCRLTSNGFYHQTLRTTFRGIALIPIVAALFILAPQAWAQNGITITVIPALAPNAYGSPNWNAWVSNATTAIQNGYASCGDPNSPSYYQRAPRFISVTNDIVTGFPSWEGLADPGDIFGAAYSQELGNRLQFGIDIKGGTNLISISQLSFFAHSTDPGNTLGFSFAQGSYNYSASYVGIIYGAGGTNTYITSGPNTQLVNEIVGRGSGNAWAVYDTSGDITSEQSNIVSYAESISTNQFSFSGIYFLAGVAGSSTITFNPLPPAPPAQDGITITVIPALAPNAYGSPNWNAWVSNATTAIQNGYASYGDPNSPSYYQRAPRYISVTNDIVTGFPSWQGLADPGDVFGAAYSQELGNRLQFGIDIKGGTNLISISQLSFTAQSSDPGNSLGFSFGLGSYNYSASYVGIIYGAGGTDTYVTSGPNTQLVNEIVGRGSGNAWAVYDTSGDIASEQSNIVSYAESISTNPFTFSGTYTLAGASGSGEISLNSFPPASAVAAGLTIANAGPNTVSVAWADLPGGFVLQTNSDLCTSNWGDYNGPITLSGGINRATIPTTTPYLFFRLSQ